MSEPTVEFSHEKVGNLLIATGLDDIAWSYNLNTANYPTYGGEVIQILSIFIDDVAMSGTVRTYPQMEAIYSFFSKYMIQASQREFNQKFMTMTYSPRGWTFLIQPLKIPGFIYSRETVAPKWQMTAHVVDDTAGNYETLKEMAESQFIGTSTEKTEFGKLKGIVSPLAADPTQNPFSAPGTKQGEAAGGKEIEKKVEHELVDYYNSLIPSYTQDQFESIQTDIGAKPVTAFGRKLNEATGEEVLEKIPGQEGK